MRKIVKLDLIQTPGALKLGVLPGFKAEEDVDLICGRCSAVIGQGISAERMRQFLGAPTVTCTCGAHNRLPAS